jgi:hypothetical protein
LGTISFSTERGIPDGMQKRAFINGISVFSLEISFYTKVLFFRKKVRGRKFSAPCGFNIHLPVAKVHFLSGIMEWNIFCIKYRLFYNDRFAYLQQT